MANKLAITAITDDYDLPLVITAGYNHFEKADNLNWHYHKGYELTFITRRSATWELENHIELDLVKGNVALTLPGVRHRGIENITFPCDMIWIVVNETIEEGLTNTFFTHEELEQIFNLFRHAGNSVTTYSPVVEAMLEELKTMFINYELYKDHTLTLPTIRGLLCQIILNTSKCFSDTLNNKISDDITAAYDYIKAHFRESIDVSHIAKHIKRSESHLYTSFKNETGQTPNELITQLRIKEALYLLKNTDKSITYIAMDTGFSSSQYFSSVFKKQLGRSPSNFRSECRKKDEGMF